MNFIFINPTYIIVAINLIKQYLIIFMVFLSKIVIGSILIYLDDYY